MLNHSSSRIRSSSEFESEFDDTADPWTEEEPISRQSEIPVWKFQPDVHPLLAPEKAAHFSIGPAGVPGRLQLPIHARAWVESEMNPIQLLIQDELKAHACNQPTISEQIENAMALLLWVTEQRLPDG